MRTYFLLFVSFLFISLSSIAQEKKEDIKIWGNCGMCKSRIEKAAKEAGASYASWSSETKILSVKYDVATTSNAKIQKGIAAVGHDTQDEIAADDVYNKLPGCCKYKRKQAAESSKKEELNSNASSSSSSSAAATKSCCSKDASAKGSSEQKSCDNKEEAAKKN